MADSDFGYANTLNGVCERVATNLRDDFPGEENEKWCKEYILAHAVDAVKMLAFTDESLFSAAVEFPLEFSDTGKHALPVECDKLLSVDSIRDDIGRVVNVQEASFDILAKTSFFTAPCVGCRSGKMGTPVAYSVAKNPKNHRELRINPKVKRGSVVTACATCMQFTPFTEDPDKLIQCDFARLLPALHQWLMFVMLSSEGGQESVAEQHRITFFDLIPYTVEDLRNGRRRAGTRR